MTAGLNADKFRRILVETLVFPVVLIGTCALGLALTTGHLLHVLEMDRHSMEVLDCSHEWQKLLIDMETGTRGYLMTGDSRFLEPYNKALPQVDTTFAKLTQLVSSDTLQSQILRSLNESIKNWCRQAEISIQKGKYGFQPNDLNDALDRKSLMDSIRAQINSFDENEAQLLSQRSANVETTKHLFFLFGIATMILLMLFTALYVWRQMKKLADSYETALYETLTQKEWFRVTLSSIGDAVIVTDVNGQVTFMNAEAERLTGWTWMEAKGKALRSIFKIVNEETRRSVDDPVEKVFKEKRVVGLANHTLLLSKGGAEWPIQDSAAPIYDPEKRMVGVVLVFHDASEARRAATILKTHAEDLEQKVLTRTMELQRTVNELESFSYTVSHDLRAPLRAMQGYSRVLLDDFSSRWGDEERDYLGRINRAAERLDILIRDLLTYSKVTKEHEAVVPVDIDRLVEDILTQYPTFQSAAFRFEVHHPLDSVLGHESKLTQVLSNLLTNAVKFRHPERSPHIKIWTEAQEFTVCLWIEDNGIGIDPSNHSRVFKMFEQVEGKKYEGTGIGLAIVKKAVENMHGTVGLESSLGNGTKIWIKLLRAKNNEPTPNNTLGGGG